MAQLLVNVVPTMMSVTFSLQGGSSGDAPTQDALGWSMMGVSLGHAITSPVSAKGMALSPLLSF